MIGDLIGETQRRIAVVGPASAADVRAQPDALASFTAPMAGDIVALKAFLFAHMYRHPRVVASMKAAQGAVTDLYGAFSANPALLPPDWAAACGGPALTASVVRDYIAGMTDRFALQEHARIFHTEISL